LLRSAAGREANIACSSDRSERLDPTGRPSVSDRFSCRASGCSVSSGIPRASDEDGGTGKLKYLPEACETGTNGIGMVGGFRRVFRTRMSFWNSPFEKPATGELVTDINPIVEA
jgi:hypothetical protein